MNSIFLGEPPAHIKQWIINHSSPDLSKPLCFTAVDGGAVIQLKYNGINLKSQVFQTSTDCINWTDHSFNASRILVNTDTSTEFILENAGDKIYFKAKNDYTNIVRSNSNYLQFATTQNTKKLNVSGNVMSMLAPEFKDLKDLSIIRNGQPGTFILNYLFQNCKNIQDCSQLNLPATILADHCYYMMFYNCTSLIKAPKLPAMTLANGCYSGMFQGCSALLETPKLNSTDLEEACYYGMFYNCTSLSSASTLPAITLKVDCYNGMFYGCSSLRNAPVLSATTLADKCCYAMFEYCRSLTDAPKLLATTLANDCYKYMFQYCTALSSIDINFESWNPYNATQYWTQNVSSHGTFTCPTTLYQRTGTDYIPYNWTIITK